jgi:hypothetical protein
MFPNPLSSPTVGRKALIKFSLIPINCIFRMHSNCPLLTLSLSLISTFIHSVIEHFLIHIRRLQNIVNIITSYWNIFFFCNVLIHERYMTVQCEIKSCNRIFQILFIFFAIHSTMPLFFTPFFYYVLHWLQIQHLKLVSTTC